MKVVLFFLLLVLIVVPPLAVAQAHYVGSEKEVTYAVVRTYGGWGWKQRYQVKIGNNHYILPIQWNQATSRWVPYNLQNWYKEDGSLKTPHVEKSFEMSCASCHNTGLELIKVGEGDE